MFLDEAQIIVHGGDGGDGLVSWRKEKYIAKGGPWGGDGGNGGNIVFLADPNTDTLSTFAQVKKFDAEEGQRGDKSLKHGKAGEDLILRVPPGTIITDSETGDLLADLKSTGDKIVVARGGRGGYGNAHFTSSVRQAPDFAEKGEPGEERKLKLELKLVAEVGIIGYPSVGKSTLISVISASKPKIGEYHFTTLVPNLGVVDIHERSFVVCDVPGLIEGASEGKGLGDTFLRHIERCGVLVHMLDLNREDIVADYKAIRKELELYSSKLSKKKELVVLNKMDLVNDDVLIFAEELKKNGIEVFASISSATKHGIGNFLNKLLTVVLEEREKHSAISIEPACPAGRHSEENVATIQPQIGADRTDAFTIEEDPKGTFTVKGKRIEQIAQMTDWQKEGGVQRFRDIAERIGLTKSLKSARADATSKIIIAKINISDHLL
jgi:GTPase